MVKSFLEFLQHNKYLQPLIRLQRFPGCQLQRDTVKTTVLWAFWTAALLYRNPSGKSSGDWDDGGLRRVQPDALVVSCSLDRRTKQETQTPCPYSFAPCLPPPRRSNPKERRATFSPRKPRGFCRFAPLGAQPRSREEQEGYRRGEGVLGTWGRGRGGDTAGVSKR